MATEIIPSTPVSLLRMPEIVRRTGLSRSTVYRMVERGEFPGPVQLTSRTVAWASCDVDGWIKRRISARAGGRNE